MLFAFLLFHSIHLSAQSNADLLVLTMDDHSQFVGRIVSETAVDILFDIEGVDNNVTLSKSFIKRKISAEDKILFKRGKYHKTADRGYSIGLALAQLEMISYKHIRPNLGVGGGAALRVHYAFDPWDEGYLKFGDLFAYGKYYVNNNRRRFFVEAKLGYAFSLGPYDYLHGRSDGKDIIYRIEQTSGFMTQPAIGFEFATKRKFNWGLKFNWTRQQTYVKRGPTEHIEDYRPRGLVDEIRNISSPNMVISFYW